MKKNLVVFFSCTGNTEKIARYIARHTGSDIFRIEPEVPYTTEDLDWNNKESRSSIEMNDLTSRPKINSKIENMDEYSGIYIGFPIWWGKAPTIINTFLESYDLTNKTIVPFGVYHSSGIGETDKYLMPSCKNCEYITAVGFKQGDLSSVHKWL